MVLADVREYKVALSCLIMIISVVLLTLFLIVWDKVRVETVFNYHSLLVSCGAVLAGYVMLLVCVTLFKEEKTLFYIHQAHQSVCTPSSFHKKLPQIH